MKAYEYLCGFLQVNRVVPLRNNYLNIGIINILQSDKLALDPNLIPIFHSAYIKRFKLLEYILITDPKRTILLLCRIRILTGICLSDLLSQFRRPLCTLV
jgi:hypothetical protein